MSAERTPLGRIPLDRIRATTFLRPDPRLVAGFLALTDLTPTVSDVLDELGVTGAIPARILAPAVPGARLAGPALTVRNVERPGGVAAAVASRRNSMGDTEAYALAEPGDVVVIEGVLDASNMGGQGVQVARREGCAGAIIDGSFRDPDAPREHGVPLWARGVTPITGKWRAETVEVNGPVTIAGVGVAPGDLVLADDGGVCIVPSALVAGVLERARAIDAGDTRRKADIDAGLPLAELMARRYR